MKRVVLAFSAVGLACLATAYGFRQSDQLDRKQLRDMISQLGYTVKDLETTPGAEKYSFVVERAGLNIPVAVELSRSGHYIWLTVFCKDGEPDGDKPNKLLHKNAEVQPCQFYLSKSNKLMMGLAIENKGVTNASFRNSADFIVDGVVNSKDVWQ